MNRLDDLLGILRSRGLLRGRDIQEALGISQPVMSRLIREAGPRVCRFGRSVAARYAAPLEIRRVGSQAPVYRVDDQGHATQHGVLHFLARGGCWLERASGDSQPFPGLPPFLEDMCLQGFIGRDFPARFPELELPTRISDWSDAQHVIALACRGDDCVGNIIVGEEALDRFLARTPQSSTRADYPLLAAGSLTGQPGSSAGGEHPKFLTCTEGRHVLVKFAGGDGAAADRFRDLLVCEHVAQEVLREAGVAAARSAWFDLDQTRFLEVERFDRVGPRGRRGVCSLHAVTCHFLAGDLDSWSRASRRILEEPALSLSAEDAERMVWLDSFGDLVGNTDRHFGNLSFFAEEARTASLTLAPAYDMLPMLFAPAQAILVERPFSPRPPTSLNFSLWHDAAQHAEHFWARLCDEPGLSDEFRPIAKTCRDALARLRGDHS